MMIYMNIKYHVLEQNVNLTFVSRKTTTAELFL